MNKFIKTKSNLIKSDERANGPAGQQDSAPILKKNIYILGKIIKTY